MRRALVDKTLKNGRHYTNRRTLSVVVDKQAEAAEPEIAIAVKKKNGSAVTRNRIKRRVSAALSAIKPWIKKGAMAVIFPFKSAKSIQFEELEQDLVSLFKEAELL